jgi:LPXTG-motif cell wall-anchored protein
LHDYYEKFALWDGILHFQSGILLGIVGFVLVYTLNEQSTKKIYLSPGFISFFAVTFSLAASVVWEIYEYLFDILLGYNMQESGLPDTMGDMIVNAIGALIVGLLGYLWMRKRKKLPFTPSDISGISDYASLHRERD